MIKKTIAVILASLLTAALSGCGSSRETPPGASDPPAASEQSSSVPENGAITEISYTNMSLQLSEQQERELISRAQRFSETHVQEKRQFAEGERFISEQTTFTYYFNLDTLRYCYALFFEYGQPALINNDWGTECNVV